MVAGTYRASRPPGDGDERARRPRRVRQELAEGFRWLAGQRVLRTMTVLIGLLNLTLTAAIAVLVLLVRERLHLGPVGYGTLFTCLAAGALLGSASGDWLIRRVTATWTIRIGLLVEAGLHLVLATSRSAYLVGFMLFAFGVHGALWTIVGSSLRQRLTPPEMLGRVASTGLFIAAGGNCVGAVLGGLIAARFGITAPYWAGFVVAVLVSAATWRVFSRAAVAEAYAEPALAERRPETAGHGRETGRRLRCGYRWEAPVRPEPEAQAAAAGLRASRADRERVIELLKTAFVQDRLARDEFDARVGQALASRTHAELAAVTVDLPAELIGAPPRRPPARARGRLSMNTAVTAGACVVAAANVGMMAALLIGSSVAVVLVAVFTVIGVILAIRAMIVAP